MEPSAESNYIHSTNKGSAGLLKIAHRKEARLLAALAAGGLVLTPAVAATSSKKRAPAVSLSFDPISSFTPANGDPEPGADGFQIHAGSGEGTSVTGARRDPRPRSHSGLAGSSREQCGSDGSRECVEPDEL